MAGKRDKAPSPFPIGPIDGLERNGRSVWALREVGSNDFEDVSNLTTDLIPLPTTDVALEIVSTSSDDRILGIGAGSVLIVALNIDFVETFLIVPLEGTIPVPVTLNPGGESGIRRINNFLVRRVGENRGKAKGDIVIRSVADPSVVYSKITAGDNTSSQALRTVPANATVSFMSWGAASSQSNKTIEFILQSAFNDPENETLNGVFITRDIIVVEQEGLFKTFPIPLVVSTGTDILISARDIEAGASFASCSFQYYINRDT